MQEVRPEFLSFLLHTPNMALIKSKYISRKLDYA